VGCPRDDRGANGGDPAVNDHEPARAAVEGPVEGVPANQLPRSVAERHGYVEEEFFVSGVATSHVPLDTPPDGHWNTRPGDTAGFTTRVLVRRPADWSRFDGTVAIEWLNVSAGVDSDPGFGLLHPVVLDRGQVWVGATMQEVGVGDSGEALLDVGDAQAMAPLKQLDPTRYGALCHPGDAFSFDMFAAVGDAARGGGLTAGHRPERVIAAGQSQSAYHLVSFINAVQPQRRTFDGFFVHSRAAGAAPLLGVPDDVEDRTAALRDIANPVAIRGDITEPVLQFETETDLLLLGYAMARQADAERLVTWEVAGTAHADASILAWGQLANGVEFDLTPICGHLNEGPQAPVLRAAWSALCGWVEHGERPPTAGPVEMDADGRIVRDGDGNALGGVRTPAVEAPWATHSGESEVDEPLCALFGSTTPLSPERLAELYPSHEHYVAAVTAAADEAAAAGFILPADRAAIVAEAEAAPVPR
jgi:hypothetical protein